MKTVCFVAAVAEELGELAGFALGVGPIAAAVSAGTRLSRERPAAVVLVGTAGRYPGGPEVGSVIASSHLGFGWAAAALGLGYVPLPPPQLEGDGALLERFRLPAARVLTVGGVTTDPGLAGRFGEAWAVEHMEAYPVAFACRELGIPFLAVLGITNDVGPGAHAAWKANRAVVETRVRDAVSGR